MQQASLSLPIMTMMAIGTLSSKGFITVSAVDSQGFAVFDALGILSFFGYKDDLFYPGCQLTYFVGHGPLKKCINK